MPGHLSSATRSCGCLLEEWRSVMQVGCLAASRGGNTLHCMYQKTWGVGDTRRRRLRVTIGRRARAPHRLSLSPPPVPRTALSQAPAPFPRSCLLTSVVASPPTVRLRLCLLICQPSVVLRNPRIPDLAVHVRCQSDPCRDVKHRRCQQLPACASARP